METLSHLQNGSDVRGVALAEPGGPAVTLTPDAANRIAAAFGRWLSQKAGKAPESLRVGVGHDSRLTAQILEEAIAQGLGSLGIQVLRCGLSSTPAMFMGTVFPETAFDGSIMITASHLPKNRNGMKFFTPAGGLDSPDIQAVLALAADLAPATSAVETQGADLIELYAASLRRRILDRAALGDRPLEGLHIVVDAGNGAGGFFVHQVLEPLGADCTGSQFLEPDGHFPNHQPNPENPEAMAALRQAVEQQQAHLGIIFDTDVDRMSAVLADGSEINRDAIIAMMAAILAPEYPGGTIVTDSVTSDHLTAFLEDRLGLRHHCFKRGYKNVINEAIRLGGQGIVTPLAIETSGHGALKENYFLDDGAYMAVRLVAAAAQARQQGQTLDSLLEGLTLPDHRRELRLPLLGEDFTAYGRRVLEEFAVRAQARGLQLPGSYEGVRIAVPGKGWLLLRLSLHDPLMPLNLEGNTAGDLAELTALAQGLLGGFDQLDLSVFESL